MIEVGEPKTLIHAEKSREAVFSAVSFWLHGMSRVEPESRHVHVKCWYGNVGIFILPAGGPVLDLVF